jgi:hypothetical protein
MMKRNSLIGMLRTNQQESAPKSRMCWEGGGPCDAYRGRVRTLVVQPANVKRETFFRNKRSACHKDARRPVTNAMKQAAYSLLTLYPIRFLAIMDTPALLRNTTGVTDRPLTPFCTHRKNSGQHGWVLPGLSFPLYSLVRSRLGEGRIRSLFRFEFQFRDCCVSGVLGSPRGCG